MGLSAHSRLAEVGPGMKVSLITVTMGNRPDALARLMDSLRCQTYRNFEHIVVDQRAHPEFRGGLSRARNYGLSLATGDIVAFPDDDAWYAPSTLQDAVDGLGDGTVAGLSFRVTDERGVCSAGGYMARGVMPLARRNVWRTAVSCSFFVRRACLTGTLFDERLGVGSGTRYGSGEETDFLLRMIERGCRLVYDGSKVVYHPRFSGVYSVRRGWLYGNGCGAVLRMHHYSAVRLTWMVFLQLLRAGQSLFAGHFGKMSFHLSMAFGRLCGYFSPPAVVLPTTSHQALGRR